MREKRLYSRTQVKPEEPLLFMPARSFPPETAEQQN